MRPFQRSLRSASFLACALSLAACGGASKSGSSASAAAPQSSGGSGAGVQQTDDLPGHTQAELKGDWVGTMTFEAADGTPQEAAFALRADNDGLVYEISDAAGNVWNLDNAEAQSTVLDTGAVLIAMSQPGEMPQTIHLEGRFDGTATVIEGAMFVMADELPQGIDPLPYADFGDDALEPPGGDFGDDAIEPPSYDDAGQPLGEVDPQTRPQQRAPELLDEEDDLPWFDPGPEQDELPDGTDPSPYGNLEDDIREEPGLLDASFRLVKVDAETYADGDQVEGVWGGEFVAAEGMTVQLSLTSNALGDLEAGLIGDSRVEPLDYHPGALDFQPWQPGVIDAPELIADDGTVIVVDYLILDVEGRVLVGPADSSQLGAGQIVLKKQEADHESF